MRKTRILTRDSTQNDPIDCRIKGFSFHDFKDNHHHLRNDFSLFFPQNLTFKHSLDAELDLEGKERERFKD